MRTGAVIVAAKISERMARIRQLVDIDTANIAERVIVNFRRAGVKDIVVVTGYNAGQFEKELKRFDVSFVRNNDYGSTQMFDSAKMGFEALADMPEKCGRVFFCPFGVPFFSDKTVRAMMQMMDANPGAKMIIPSFSGRDGHPLLIDCEALPELLSYDGGRGMKGAFESLDAGSVIRLAVDDAGTVRAADTRDSYQKLMDIHNERIMHPVVKLSLASTTSFFGPGSAELLKEVDRCGNVREACANCGFSYSKGWSLLKRCEEKYGYKIVERRVGGRNGGAAYVTDKGHDLLAIYETMQSEISDAADARFRELMHEYHLTDREDNDR
ncbi:MAG: NTP transferase domain-containing protein [Mogibacterium sp.]|nr:NTP transferase domain-containing protein [Mogibacterium sp.]